MQEARGRRPGELLASVLAGGAAVAAANTLLPSRRSWHVDYYTAVLNTKRPVGVGVVAAASAISGAVVLGGADTILRAVGLGLG